MKKTILTLFTTIFFSSILMANGDWYYSPKRYAKSYLFSLNFAGEYKSESDMTVIGGSTYRKINYIGNSEFSWGYVADFEFGAIKSNNTVFRANLDLGPTLGYNITKKTNLYTITGYSILYMNDFKDDSDFQTLPFAGIGMEYFFNDDFLLYTNYKYKRIDKDNPWNLSEKQDQLNFGIKITYR